MLYLFICWFEFLESKIWRFSSVKSRDNDVLSNWMFSNVVPHSTDNFCCRLSFVYCFAAVRIIIIIIAGTATAFGLSCRFLTVSTNPSAAPTCYCDTWVNLASPYTLRYPSSLFLKLNIFFSIMLKNIAFLAEDDSKEHIFCSLMSYDTPELYSSFVPVHTYICILAVYTDTNTRKISTAELPPR